jgi:F-type H+-transporting ATPase subunit a
MAEIHIPTLAPEVIGHIGPIAITNTLVNVWIGILVLATVAYFLRKLTLRPGKFQNGCELVVEMLLPYFDSVTQDRRKTMRFLPIVGSVFFFILLSNWLGLIPGTGSITVGHSMLLRPANTDLNLTLAMALVAVLSSHVFGMISVGVFVHIGKFLQFGNFFKSFAHGPIAVFQAIIEFGVGLLEIVSEIAKVLSLSLRLFGNIFAGEVLISVITALVSLAAPTPFMLLELLVGLIQASVFAMLTLVYLTVAVEEPHGSH